MKVSKIAKWDGFVIEWRWESQQGTNEIECILTSKSEYQVKSIKIRMSAIVVLLWLWLLFNQWIMNVGAITDI